MQKRRLTEGRVVSGSLFGVLALGAGILLFKLGVIIFVLWLLYKVVMHFTGG